MSYALFFDTETTGLPIEGLPDSDDRQPHLVQVAACLVDLNTRTTISSMDVMVRPADWVIPDEVAAIHGITTHRATVCGVAESMAVELLLALGNGVLRVAHNLAFDDRMVRIALARYFWDDGFEWDRHPEAAGFCTMQAAAPVLRLPASARMVQAGRGHQYKQPRLAEAYQHFTGQPMVNAHNAMADVQACMAVFFALEDSQGGAA